MTKKLLASILCWKSLFHNCTKKIHLFIGVIDTIKVGLYRIWCGVNRLDDSGVNTLGDTSAFVNPTVQLL